MIGMNYSQKVNSISLIVLFQVANLSFVGVDLPNEDMFFSCSQE